jgi:D-alanyl-D-alanine carboxypeptidase (penicillin-binding protein 5/6)
VLVALLVCVLGAGPALAVPAPPRTPVPTPTPEPPLPGQGPDGVATGGKRMGSVNVQLPVGVRALPAGISPRGWVLADLDTGEVLAARNAHGRYPPASTQKWLTALTLLPQFPDRRKKIVATDADVNVDGTRVGLVANGRYTIDLLFQSMLMASGNDAANALARVAGSVPRTVAAMNAEAQHLQAYDTHAATPSGLDGPKQLTSAYDLALVARAALARADFRKYTGQTRGMIPAQSTKYHAFEFANDNKLLYDYPGAFGGKNGFTDAAHHTFIGAARKGNRRLIVTMMYGEHKPDNISLQAGRMLDWGFALPRTAEPVGTLVSPLAPGATPAPSASGSPAPSPAADAVSQGAAGGSNRPVVLLAAGLAVLLALGWAAIALARRS